MGEQVVMKSEDGECLPKMVLRVLLVEADDCTRQLIAALLRKCGYRVAAVSDGLKAWETLKESSHNIDLVLTEVELPSISGYALLTLIVEHDMCKNIPVIMMSSKDSISTVLKCMVKGAADFLIKPVRKNELRNLWQHVWRRKKIIGQQSAGSRPQNKALENQKTVEVSENDTASNYSSDNLASIQRHEECVEMDERSFMPKSKPLANMASSEMGTSSGMGPYSSVGISSEEGTLCAEPRAMSPEVQHVCHSENTYTVDEVDCQLNELYYSAPCTEEAFDLIGKFENCLADGQSYDSKVKSNVGSRLGLSLLTFNPGCSKDEWSGEQNMKSHSKASAFSKYETKKTLQHPYSGLTSDSTALKEGSSASTWEHDNSLIESEQDTTALVMRQPRWSPRSQSPFPTSSLTYSTSDVQIMEHDAQPFNDGTIHSEGNAAYTDNGKLAPAEKARSDSATCGSSDLGSGVTDKLSSSRCGSNSNEAIESSLPVASPGRAPISESVNYNDIPLHDRTRGENHCTSQREAALMKFRLKRKDRCFEKKVRYQSRKRLAEQRPRVKGQFVRQLQNETQPVIYQGETPTVQLEN